MLGIGRVKRQVRNIHKTFQNLRTKAREYDPHPVHFVCNVCGQLTSIPRRRFSREDGACSKCGCYGRLRALMYAVTSQFSPGDKILAKMPPRKDIRGVGCSDWGYTSYLEEKFDYVNTFYHKEPRLDLCDIDWSRWPRDSVDFITCTDVLEHVPPPVQKTFENMHALLKPGGVAILTVPTSLMPASKEHYPDTHDWSVVEEDHKWVFVNHRIDGVTERFENPIFHGGDGQTIEFRQFSRQGLLDDLTRAGFHIAAMYDQPVMAHAIPLCEYNFVVVARKD